MRRWRILGFCLTATCVLCIVSATGASAFNMNEHLVCAKATVKEAGTFNDKLCSVSSKGGRGEGKYELANWEHAKKKTFTGSGGVSTFSAYIPGLGVVGTVTCKKQKVSGELTGPASSTMKIIYTGCASSGESCSSEGGAVRPAAENGEAEGNSDVLEKLENGHRVVSEVHSESGKGALVEVKCGGETVTLSGSTMGATTGNINHISKTHTVSFVVNSGGENIISENVEEPGVRHALVTEISGVGSYETGLSTTLTLKGEAMEVYAPEGAVE